MRSKPTPKTVKCQACGQDFHCPAAEARFYCGHRCSRLGSVARRDMRYSSEATVARYASFVAEKKERR